MSPPTSSPLFCTLLVIADFSSHINFRISFFDIHKITWWDFSLDHVESVINFTVLIHEHDISTYLDILFLSSEFYGFSHIDPVHVLLDLCVFLSFGANINSITYICFI